MDPSLRARRRTRAQWCRPGARMLRHWPHRPTPIPSFARNLLYLWMSQDQGMSQDQRVKTRTGSILCSMFSISACLQEGRPSCQKANRSVGGKLQPLFRSHTGVDHLA